MKKIINLMSNHYDISEKVKLKLIDLLTPLGYEVTEEYNGQALYNVVIGGDGTFIRACHDSNFSSIPFIGINTGHLGFYQEIDADRVDLVVDTIRNENPTIQQLKLVECKVNTEEKDYFFYSLNEVVLKAKYASIIHFNMYVNDILLQSFSGDGVIFSTPSGSTAYNLSAGGAILFPSIDCYQVTPIAPIRSSLFQSLDKSLVVPASTEIKLLTRKREETYSSISIDGVMQKIEDIRYIDIKLADKVINKVVLNPNWYWKNIKDKFI